MTEFRGRPRFSVVVTLVALVASGCDVAHMALGAVVTSVKRQISKRSGSEFARLTVEDFSGSTEVLIFPEKWAAIADQVKTDIPVLLKGGYSKRDRDVEGPTFIVESITRFADMTFSGQIGVSITLGGGRDVNASGSSGGLAESNAMWKSSKSTCS